ncbi:cysteine hydrolase [Actinomadura sp. GC306]|uniref:cysteine hydrolase family protein n=1 Tax=Actinomadura sp. GC306 TaxID=2530367 RepID=UPI001043580E|nr:isochorismatase family cysteine hydrolase [Actinomadura sp. GC306]TDC64604.1 cysteine hydrolase [Actinomadura sp. GC306]
MEIKKENTALLVVDMQNSFTEPKGSMAAVGLPYEELLPAVAGCRTLIDAAHTADVPVIYTRYVFQPDYADGGLVPDHIVPALKENRGLAAGSWDAEICDELAPAEGDIVIDKSRPSAFYGTRLEPVLTGLGVRSLVICGVTTNICVETTARDAGQRDYFTHVISDATAEFDKARHEYALNGIGFIFGWVNTIDDVLRAWA